MLDLLPLHGGLELACSGDLVARDSCRAALSVWDVASGAPLSAQLYQERYTLPCLEELPPGNAFLAQSNGNYVAMFDATRPYRLNKKLRYEGHTVGGHAVRCSTSLDGVLLCSGDAEGVAHVYKVRSGVVASVVAVPGGPAVTHPHWHPSRPGLLALGCADGSVHLCR
ncbi:WD repeat-containing protein 25 isoform X1 [Ixodes scapularis]